ncbi:hypothetical protein WJX74_010584 [Apatococcus lobatus]|uniref:Uncharacterized protein n=1 Tax=Apatococcus lobatus TaxID=904363 RepID=A0AAW1Q684_9CHLO
MRHIQTSIPSILTLKAQTRNLSASLVSAAKGQQRLPRSGTGSEPEVEFCNDTGHIPEIIHLINQIDADQSGHTGADSEKAKFILSQRTAFGLDQTAWQSLLLRLPAFLRQEVDASKKVALVATALIESGSQHAARFRFTHHHAVSQGRTYVKRHPDIAPTSPFENSQK